MSINQLLQKANANLAILQANFGIERESLRINRETHTVAKTEHPSVFGSRSFHPYIQTDYSEPQLELITPVAHSTKEAVRQLTAITDVASRSINRDEYLWPLSMPPKITEDDIQIAQLESPFEYRYREYLGERYGKLLQSMSGIHYNIELGEHLVNGLYQLSDYDDKVSFKNDLYLKLAQNFLRFRWLITYLYAASPLAEAGFLTEDLDGPVRSIRSSHLGYVNHDDIKVPYHSLEDYISTIEGYINTGQLIAEKEFYSAVRLRGSKQNRDYLTKGVTYLEYRCFDINPYSVIGITQETVDTVHLLTLALLWLDSSENVDEAIDVANALNDTIALSHPLTALPDETPVKELLTAMQEVIDHFQLPSYYQDLLNHVKEQINNPALTVSGRLVGEMENSSLTDFARREGQAHQDYAWQAHYALKGYEPMELSTQLLMFDAIQKGVHLEILDEQDQFLKLWHNDHVEYVKNGNMTSKDNYVIPLAMENKIVTKKILAEQNFPVPAGDEFSNKTDALAYYPQIRDKAIVVKPKSTNFGLGISIFKEPASREDFEKALDIAFKEDSDVLVEEYIDGTEYRFFVLDGKCEAVLLRVAANVVGDGKHSIRELVAIKNDNPLRGRDHRSPLEIIDLGEIELLMLAQQGYQPDDVLEEGVKVDLRRNSNISTGGDSIDVTDSMDESYKELAANVATAMGAWACGVDLIIPDTNKASTSDEPNATCIETNFNPCMYMHTYCQEGPGQALTPKILAKLFPECH